MRRLLRPLVPLSVLLLLLVGAASCTTEATGTPAGVTSGTAPAAIQKIVLNQQKDPPGAPGRTLTLIRYVIAPGAKLSPHVHPGVQLAYIEAGTLTYTIVSGTATVRRAGGDPTPVTGPTTITLDPGDAVTETDGMVHYGANEGAVPLVILATLLTDSSQDLAVTVSIPSP
jgi:oxalate decarboxylase/phosphoglucose isomerase-like protein (cupin superfamily)